MSARHSDPRADLHAHTTASDGSLSATDLVRRAAENDVSVLAITDHDTLDAVREAIVAGVEHGVRIVPGIELSVRMPTGTMHLLGYFFEPEPPALVARLAELRAARERRAQSIVARLASLGAPIDYAQVRARARGSIGRPHIAETLVAAGHATDRQDAFDRFLADGAAAWVPSEGLAPEEAVELVRAGGGAPVLAHPASLRMSAKDLTRFVQRLTAAGLAGIEVHRPEHTEERRRQLRTLAQRFGLVATGGSDFHHPQGRNQPGDSGDPPLPLDAVDRLLATCGR